MKLLYLVHRIPFPPNKGDKVRSYHLLKHLAGRHEVHLGTFIDDPDDEPHLPRVRALCAGPNAARLTPRIAKLASLRGLLTGEALSLPYYRDAGLQAWVRETAPRVGFDAVVVFSGVMAQYVPNGLRHMVDFVDVDSAKWRDYAPEHSWPLSWLYRREGERLLDFERDAAATVDASLFVTEAEAALFRRAAPALASRVGVMQNGVDADFFSPANAGASPYPSGGPVLAFSGAMDYWPNIDAVTWFANEILPAIRRVVPDVRFWIVGMNPAPAVQALAGEDVVVSGTVPDVRPYLAHADLVVAPLRIARGIQNKVLEAMAMARPVVAARACVEAIEAREGHELLAAESAEDYAQAVSNLLQQAEHAAAVGAAGRQRVLDAYSWDARLAGIDQVLEGLHAPQAASSDVTLSVGAAA